MEVTLTPELEALVNEKVRSGRYIDASEVVREALRALEQSSEFELTSLEVALLEGVQSPHQNYDGDTLEQVREMSRQLRR